MIVDDYIRWIWVTFLSYRNESFKFFYKFLRKFQNEKVLSIIYVRSDYDREFENDSFR